MLAVLWVQRIVRMGDASLAVVAVWYGPRIVVAARRLVARPWTLRWVVAGVAAGGLGPARAVRRVRPRWSRRVASQVEDPVRRSGCRVGAGHCR